MYKEKPRHWGGAGSRRGWGLEPHKLGAFGTNAALNRTGDGELAATAATGTFMADVNLFGENFGVIEVAEEPSESFCARGVWGDVSFVGFAVAENGTVENGTEERIRIFVIWAVQEGDVETCFVFGLAHLVGEAGAGDLRGEGEDGIASEGEGLYVNHVKTLTGLG